jgi:dihydrofolate reductase
MQASHRQEPLGGTALPRPTTVPHHVGGQALALGLIDEVVMDVVPVVFGRGKRYFGALDAQQLLEDSDVVIQGRRVLHLRYRVRR